MKDDASKSSAKIPASKAEEIEKRPAAYDGASGVSAELLGLQQTAGNGAVTSLLRGNSGKPLDPSTRAKMEAKFGQSFSDVRIHDNSVAAGSAEVLGANAFTAGQDIVFSEGHYSPDTTSGKKLIAHELAHVVQQRRGGAEPQTFDTGSAAEHDAANAAGQAENGAPVTVNAATGAGVAREEAELPWWKKRLNPLYQKALEVLPKDAAAKLREANSVARALVQGSGVSDESLNKAVKAAEPVLEPIDAALDAEKKPPAALSPAAAPAATPTQTAPTPQASPKPAPGATGPLTDPKQNAQPAREESVEELEARMFYIGNPYARQNLTKIIEALGGPSYDSDKVSYQDLLEKYQRLKNGPKWDQPSNVQYLEKSKPGGIPLAEIERQQRLQWENLDRFEHEPGAWIAGGAFITGKSPDEISQALNDAQTVTGFAQTAGAVGAARDSFGGVVNSPENNQSNKPDISLVQPKAAEAPPPTPAPAAAPYQPIGPVTLPFAAGPAANDSVLPNEPQSNVIPLFKQQQQANAVPLARASGQDFAEPDPDATRASNGSVPKPALAPAPPVTTTSTGAGAAPARAPRNAFRREMRDALDSASDPAHPLYKLTEKAKTGSSTPRQFNKVTRITESGKTQTGRYHGGETAPVVQAGHVDSYAGGGPQRFALEDADNNQFTGNTIESRGQFSEKDALLVTKPDGSKPVWVEGASLRQWERLGVVAPGTVDAAEKRTAALKGKP